MPPAIETHGLTPRFGARPVVDGVSMSVPERAVYGLDVARDEDALVARFGPDEHVRHATAVRNRVLCVAGMRIHALAQRRHSLETLYRQAAG